MCLKNKIIATLFCGIMVGIGLFGLGGNSSNIATATSGIPASTASNILSIEQLQQIVLNLQQQIQQLIQLISQLKPLETCGNGICRFGETAATCAADCGDSKCIQRGQIIGQSEINKCCEGLIPLDGCYVDGVGSDGYAGCSLTPKRCGTLCGNGKCETGVGETAASCATDCANINSDCPSRYLNGIIPPPSSSVIVWAKNPMKGICCQYSSPNAAPSEWKIFYSKEECVGISPVCGNGSCESGETAASCATDCGTPTAGGKARCFATGGLWEYVSNLPCIASDQESRIKKNFSCSASIQPGYSCKCPNGKYYGSYEEGCILNDCGNGTCESGETSVSCAKDCPTTTCFNEGEGIIGLTAGPVKSCCAGLTAQDRVTQYSNGTASITEGFICRKTASCPPTSNPLDSLDCACKNYCVNNGYASGSCQNFGVATDMYVKMSDGPSCSAGLPSNYNQTLTCYCKR